MHRTSSTPRNPEQRDAARCEARSEAFEISSVVASQPKSAERRLPETQLIQDTNAAIFFGPWTDRHIRQRRRIFPCSLLSGKTFGPLCADIEEVSIQQDVSVDAAGEVG